MELYESEMTEESPNCHIINDNVRYVQTDILEYNPTDKFDLIYMDPPYETNRTFTVNSLDNQTGFNDVWEQDEYAEWLDGVIKHLLPMLSTKGTLVFHISTENSFVAETVLRTHFKKITNIYWKRCHGKNTVKNKLGEMTDVLFACSNNPNSIFNMLYLSLIHI